MAGRTPQEDDMSSLKKLKGGAPPELPFTRMDNVNKQQQQQQALSFRQRVVQQASSLVVDVVVITSTVLSNAQVITNSVLTESQQRGLQVVSSVVLLNLIPLMVFGRIPSLNPIKYLQQVQIAWTSLLHSSLGPVSALAIGFGFYLVRYRAARANTQDDTSHNKIRRLFGSFRNLWLLITVGLTLVAVVTSQLQIISPCWLWHPFIWGRYTVYRPSGLRSSMQGMCLDYKLNDSTRDPLCLSRHDWKILSGGALDSSNRNDVEAVVKGIDYTVNESGGLILNVMARDTIDAMVALRQNVEALLPFFPNKLAVVVFENDSTDGTRQAFQEWSKQVAQDYKVDLVSCGEDNPDCKFGESHRYDAIEAKDYFKSSAVGRMGEFRQRIVDHILQEPYYKDYSHMMVIDIDLKISLSPFGILHSLGRMNNVPIASSARQVWPGSYGTLIPPYDFSAFRAVETPENRNILKLHQHFCNLMPPGDRWHNQCDAVSPMHMMLMLDTEWYKNRDEIYPTVSSFNGATLYPLELIKKTNAKYHAGEDGQQCEHIGFNVNLKVPTYVNPKWDMYLSPYKPGGPSGTRALKNVFRIIFVPRLSIPISLIQFVSLGIYVYCIMIIGMYILYPCVMSCIGIVSGKTGHSSSTTSINTVAADDGAPKDNKGGADGTPSSLYHFARGVEELRARPSRSMVPV